MPVLRGAAKSPRAEMFWQRRDDRAARVGDHKWVASAKGSGLFDLAADPGETKDLSKDRPDVLEKVKAGTARVFTDPIVLVVRTCREELRGSPTDALPELVERLARQRLRVSLD